MRRISAYSLFALLALFVSFFPVLQGRLPVPAAVDFRLIPDAPPAEVNPQLSDVATQFLPWTHAVAEAYRHGRMPFRFASNGAGTPLWGNMQAQAAAPTTLLALLFPLPWAFALAAAAKLFAAEVGSFLLLRRHGPGRLASAFGAVAFAFSVYFGALLHFPQTYPLALLPWCLLALDRAARGARGAFAAVFVSVFLLLLGGHAEGEFYVALAGAGYLSARLFPGPAPGRWRRFGTAIAASLLAAGLAAAYLVPVAKAILASERSGLARATDAAPPPPLSAADWVRPAPWWRGAAFFAVPEAQGNPRDGDSIGPGSMAGRAGGYVGILTLGLALGACLWRGAPAAVRWSRRAAAAYLIFLFYPPARLLLLRLPGIRAAVIRVSPNQSVTVITLAAALLAASQLERLRRDARPRRAQAIVFAGLAALTVGLGFRFRIVHPEFFTLRRGVTFALPVILLGGAVLALRTRRFAWYPFAALVAAGTAVDLARIDARFDPGTSPGGFYPATPFVRRLQQASGGGRFAATGIEMSGMAAMYGLEDVRVHDPTAPYEYEETLRAAAGYTGPYEYFQRITRPDAPFLASIGVRAVFDSAAGTISTREAAGAFFPERMVGLPDRPALLAAISSAADFRRSAFRVGRSEEFSGPSSVEELRRPDPERVLVRVRAAAPRILVLAVENDGGWRAEGNGRPLPVSSVNGAFLGVAVPGGETLVECRYTPPGFREGLAVSAASAVVLLILAAGAAVRRPLLPPTNRGSAG